MKLPQSWAETSTFLKTNLSIVIVGHRFSTGRQKWPCRLVAVDFKFLTNNVTFVCRVYLSVVVVLYVAGCRATVVQSWLLIVGCRFQLLLLVSDCRVSVVGCWLLFVGVGCSSLFPMSVPGSETDTWEGAEHYTWEPSTFKLQLLKKSFFRCFVSGADNTGRNYS